MLSLDLITSNSNFCRYLVWDVNAEVLDRSVTIDAAFIGQPIESGICDSGLLNNSN